MVAPNGARPMKKDHPEVPITVSEIAKTGKARASIKRHWQGKTLKKKKEKRYNSSVWIALPHIPGTLGEVSTLFGKNNANIIDNMIVLKGFFYLTVKKYF